RGDGSDRLLEHERSRARGTDEDAAVAAAALLAVELEQIRSDLRLDARLRERFALLERRDARNVIHTLPDQLCRTLEHACALLRRRALPLPEAALGRLERPIQVRGIDEGQFAEC